MDASMDVNCTTTPPTPQILLTGATGFIGGTVLDSFLKSTSPTLGSITITCLVRGNDRAIKLSSIYGNRVRPIVYRGLDDLEMTVAVAAEHDIVISTTLGFHASSALALVRGLAQRKSLTGRDVWMIHLSGTSNLAPQPISGAYVEKDPDRSFDDVADDIYGYEQERDTLHPYPQRTTELAVVDAGLESGVRTVVMMPPLIYGIGTGLFNKVSQQIPTYIRTALKQGHAVVVGKGEGCYDHVHVEDLAKLYEIVVTEMLRNGGINIPTGRKSIIFSGNGRQSWCEVAQAVADVLYDHGKILDSRVESISLAEGASVFAWLGQDDQRLVEVGLSSGARTVASVAKSLGWTPTKGEAAWRKGFQDDVRAVLEESESS